MRAKCRCQKVNAFRNDIWENTKKATKTIDGQTNNLSLSPSPSFSPSLPLSPSLPSSLPLPLPYPLPPRPLPSLLCYLSPIPLYQYSFQVGFTLTRLPLQDEENQQQRSHAKICLGLRNIVAHADKIAYHDLWFLSTLRPLIALHKTWQSSMEIWRSNLNRSLVQRMQHKIRKNRFWISKA